MGLVVLPPCLFEELFEVAFLELVFVLRLTLFDAKAFGEAVVMLE